jgi:hypothetical protein
MVTRTIWYRRCEFIIYPPSSSTGRWRVLIWPPSRDARRAMPFPSTDGEAINEAQELSVLSTNRSTHRVGSQQFSMRSSRSRGDGG